MSEKNGFLNLMAQVDGFIFHPLTLGFVGFAVLCAVIVFGMNNIKTGKSNPLKFSETPWLNAIYWFAIFFAPILALIFVSILAMLAQVGFRILSGDTMQGEADNLRWYVLAFVGLLTALGGIIGTPLALIRVHTTERQTKTAEQASKVSEQNHLTEILNKAVTNLGAEKTVKRETANGSVEKSVPALEVRSGGLLALERIARDNHSFHIEVMEILTAYLRHNAQAYVEYKAGSERHIRPRDDLVTALNVLSRRSSEQRHIESNTGYIPDLSNTTFAGLALSNVDFSNVNLENTAFRNSYLKKVDFTRSNLIRTKFDKASIFNCSYTDTILMQTSFKETDIRMINFTNKMIGISMRDFSKATISNSEINFPEYTNQQLEQIKFSTGSSITEHSLVDKPENFISRCAFVGADLSASGVTQEQLNRSYGTSDTKLPSGLTFPEHWEDRFSFSPVSWQKHADDNMEIPF